MTRRNLEELSKGALIREFEKLETEKRWLSEATGDEQREQLIHDLHVHQVELEMQNRELREAQVRLEEATARYLDLYDFAPVGYCTLYPDGRIQELNLTAAALLGAPRDSLLDQSFVSVAPLKDKRLFLAHMKRCLTEKVRVTSELAWSAGEHSVRTVQLISDPVPGDSGGEAAFRTILVDISGLKALEDRLRLLSTAGERLALSVEYTRTIEEAADIVVPALGDLCLLDMLGAGGNLERLVVRFACPQKQEALAQKLMQANPQPGWQTPQSRVIASGQPMLLSEVSAQLPARLSDAEDGDPFRLADVRSLMVVPLTARGRTFGALTLAAVESDRRYTSTDLQVVQALSDRVAVALDNARLYDDTQRANTALRLAEAKASGIVSIAADAIITIDGDHRIALFNKGAERIFGYTKQEVVGGPFDILIPERFRTIHRRHIQRFAEGDMGAREMGERGAAILGVRKGGHEFPAEAAISKLEVGGERILTVALRDVTDAKRVERDQKVLADIGPLLSDTLNYEDTLTRLTELVVREICHFCIVDVMEEDGRYRRLGVVTRDPSKQWICDALMDFTIDESRTQSCWGALETRDPILVTDVTPTDISCWAQNEEHHHVLAGMDPTSIIAVPLLARGRVMGVLKIINSGRAGAFTRNDVQLMEEVAYRAALAIDNARLYRTAERAIQARDDLLGIVAHDLRNPLNGILLALRLFTRPQQEPERRSQTSVELISRSVTRMKRMIEDLLDVSQMEAGNLSVEQIVIDARKSLVEFAEAQRPLAVSHSLELQVDVADDLGEVFADRDRLLQVLENLLGNAVKFTPAGGRLTVGARPRDNQVLFWVADTGAGIPSDDVTHLFDRFWQARKAGRHGVGLGLPIVRGIVEAHGGCIWVESQVAKGSTFFFTLPSSQSAAPMTAGSLPADTQVNFSATRQ